MSNFRSFAACLVAALAVCLTAGCGDANLGRVEGTVTLDGSPLENAMVTFMPKEGGRPAAARTDAQGHYELIFSRDSDGALVGEHSIAISTYAENYSEEDDTAETVPERIPTRYNVDSELEATVESGWNEIDFALETRENDEIFQPVE